MSHNAIWKRDAPLWRLVRWSALVGLIFTTFTPNDDSCVPGGAATIYTSEGSFVIGGGIPSRPVLVLRDKTAAILVSVGSTNPDANSPVTTAGTVKPVTLPNAIKLLPIWWKEM